MINLKNDSEVREIVPEGNHVARLYSIIEVGTVPVAYQEEPSRQIRLTWELSEELREFDSQQKPMVIGNKYTASMYKEAKLRKVIEGMVGKLTDEQADEFDLRTVLGKPCLLNVVHTVAKNGKTYANVASAAPLPKAVKEVPEQMNKSIFLGYEDWDEEMYQSVPQWIKNEMDASVEMKTRSGVSQEKDVFSKEIDNGDIDASLIPF